jgi:hypothetical protein
MDSLCNHKDGLTMNHLFVLVPPYDNTRTLQTNTLSSTVMRFTSLTSFLHRLLQALYKTRTFQPPRKSTSPCVQHWLRGQKGTPFHLCGIPTWKIFGNGPSSLTTPLSLTTSPTKTLLTIQTTLPQCHLPQRGQAGHFSSNILPNGLL